MSFNLNNGIPESDLPVKEPGALAQSRYVENGKPYLSPPGAISRADSVSFSDPYSSSSVTVADVINGERVSVLRCIPRDRWSAIVSGEDDGQWHSQINALLAQVSANGGGEVFFPAGFYGLGGKLSVPSGVTLRGVKGATWLRPEYDPSTGPLLVEISGKSNVSFIGIGFDGRKSAVTGFLNTVVVYQSTGVVFDSCHWKDTKGIGVAFSTDISNSGVRNSIFENVGDYNVTTGNLSDRRQAIAFSSGSISSNLSNFADDNAFISVGLDCISISRQMYFSAQRNRVRKNYAGCIYDSGSLYTIVSGNHLVDVGGNAIDVNGSDYGLYSSNTVIGANAAGIMLGGDGVSGAVVSGNMIRDTVKNPETLHKGAITIDGNGGDMSDIEIVGNVCTGGSGWGFYVRPGSTVTGRISIPSGSNTFSGNSLGHTYGIGTAYSGAVSRRTFTLAPGESAQLMPAMGGSSPNFATISVVRTNDSRLGVFFTRGTGQVTKLLDPANVFEPTDTGTESAVFYDSVSGGIVLKNNSSVSRVFSVGINGIGGS